MIDRYGADTARLFVMFAAPAGADAASGRTPASKARPLPAAAVDVRAGARDAIAARAGAAVDARCRGACATRGARSTSTLKQANYDYERIQYNTVVSAGMKMLNALEAIAAGRAGRRRRRCAKACRSCCACSIRSCRTPRGRCGATSASPRASATCSTRRGPQVDAAALVQDEIELVLQVNGKLRGKLRRAGGARTATAIEAAARAPRRSREARRRRAGAQGHRRARPARQRGRLDLAPPRVARRSRCARSRSAAAALAACGFHLRGAGDLPVRHRST